MLTEKQFEELREHLEKAQNPVFLYDNDADGFCSFVLLRRFIGRGKGVAVRTYPEIDIGYAKRAKELGADYIFVLDRPFLGENFVNEIEQMQIPLVWIDHHNVDPKHYSHPHVRIFNPTLNNEKSDEPVTYLCYKLAKRVEDMWIAMMGCISDHYLPEFAGDFAEKYGDLWGRGVKKPFEAYYKTEIGRIARAVGFGLKDSITHVVYLQNFMINAKSPLDVLSELETRSSFAYKYNEIKKRYDELLSRAIVHTGKKLLFFQYGGTTSISADLANELCYLYPNLVVGVAYNNGAVSNISLRGKGVRVLLEKIIKGFEGASGGGHDDAVGARIRTTDLDRFREDIEKELK